VKLASWNLIRELVLTSDVVLEVVDVRDPINTRSTKLEGIVSELNKSLILVINKSDLVPRDVAESWKRYFNVLGLNTVYISARDRLGTRVLRSEINKLKTGKKPLVIAVVGYPKVGKSTLINTLKGRHSASTSTTPGSPGYTKKSRLYRISGNIYLIDTPGLVPPEGDDVELVIRARPIDEIENVVNVAIKLINKVLKYNRTAFTDAYGITDVDPYRILEVLALKRGWISKKEREPLIHEAAKTVIRDYLDGKIVFYYTPDMISKDISD
jgi:ribosome biogenesis GTPase A